jgi:hypothetical protein
MARFFNTAGPCDPRDHYMLAPETRLPELRTLVAQKAYIVVHAPRQSGKTTTLRHMAAALLAEGRYAAVLVSCEAARTAEDIGRGIPAVIRAIDQEARLALPPDLQPEPPETSEEIEAELRLKEYLRRWSERSRLPVVLFLDEIDALLAGTLLSVLQQLRDGYASRPEHYPQSVALVGLRDVRDYKIPLSPGLDRLGTSSPFNIKVESLLLPNFTAAEVAALYGQHQADTGQAFSAEASARAWELTRGQPWLVNALARQLVERQVPDRSMTIETAQVEAAKEELIRRRDTHMDSLASRLREPRVRRIIEPILAGELLGAEVSDDDLDFAEDLGLVARGPAGLEIANPIYREVIPRALTTVTESSMPQPPQVYVDAEGRLRFEKLMADFASFWREHAGALLSLQAYPEVAAQLVFMAFLQRLVNGGGFIEREYAVGSGRIDLNIRWPLPGGRAERFALELKVWREGRPDPQPRGLEQLSRYLDQLGLDTGTLVVFDLQPEATRKAPVRNIVPHLGRDLVVWRF